MPKIYVIKAPEGSSSEHMDILVTELRKALEKISEDNDEIIILSDTFDVFDRQEFINFMLTLVKKLDITPEEIEEYHRDYNETNTR